MKNENYNILITASIKRELQEIAERNDEDAHAARTWLKYSSGFFVESTKKEKTAEDELFEICKKKEIPLVTDDIKAVKKFEDVITCFFSIHIIYLPWSYILYSALLSVKNIK